VVLRDCPFLERKAALARLLRIPRLASCSTNTSLGTALSSSHMPAGLALTKKVDSTYDPGPVPSGSKSAIRDEARDGIGDQHRVLLGSGGGLRWGRNFAGMPATCPTSRRSSGGRVGAPVRELVAVVCHADIRLAGSDAAVSCRAQERQRHCASAAALVLEREQDRKILNRPTVQMRRADRTAIVHRRKVRCWPTAAVTPRSGRYGGCRRH
jgi:hypothetical protein